MLFHCKLVSYQGFIQDSFFRQGKTAESVKEGLEMFCWPKGDWVITPEYFGSEEDD